MGKCGVRVRLVCDERRAGVGWECDCAVMIA